MNITDNLIRIKEGKDNIIKSLKNKGVSIDDNTLINEIPTIIDNAEIGGGGGDTPSVPTELVPKYEGASVFRIEVPNDNYEFAINLCNDPKKATYDVDWGDGVLESGLTTDEQHHTYSKKGTYDVNVYNISKEITLGNEISYPYTGAGSQQVYYCSIFNNSNNDYWDYGLKGINDCSIVKKIILNNNISTKYKVCLKDCINLETLEIITSSTSLGSNYFDGVRAKNIIIPNTINTLNQGLFQSCEKLKSFEFNDSITTIPSYCFNICSNLTSVTIPQSVTSIGSAAFQSCTSLQSIFCYALTAPTIQTNTFQINTYKYTKRYLYVPKESTGYNEGNWKTLIDKGWGLRYIEDYEKTPTTLKLKIKNNFFQNLQTIGQANLINYELIDNEYIYHFDDKIIELFKFTFYNTLLEEIELPEGLERLNDNVFQTSLLSNILLPNSLTYIGNYVFNDCKLLEIVIPEKVRYIGEYCFYSSTSLQSVTIPNSVTTIGKQAFQSCTSLKNLIIPNSVTSIASGICSQCSSLQSIEIPDSATSIGSNAFYNCVKLSTITCKALTAPTIQSNTFSSVGSQVPSGTPKVLRVPEGSDYSTWLSKLSGFTVEYIPLSEL